MKTTYSEQHSPVQQPPIEMMDFNAAISEIAKGKKVHKLEWKDKGYYAMLVNQILKLHKPDGKFYDWVLQYGDLTGDDYIVIS